MSDFPANSATASPAIRRLQRKASGSVWSGAEIAEKRRDAKSSRTNPLHGLTLTTLRDWLDRALHGDFPKLMWLYGYMERRYGDLGAIIDRREGALKKLRSAVYPLNDSPAAAVQAADLEALYAGIENLDEAIAHFHLAEFRGFSVAQVLTDALGWPVRLDCIPHWHIRRDGLYGAWRFCAHDGDVKGTPIGGSAFLIRVIERPINEVAALRWIPQNFTWADFNSFMEAAADPPTYVIKPPPGIMSEVDASSFDDLADEALLVKRGVFPNGTNIIAPGGDIRSAEVFKAYFDIASQPVILRGTGGLLTMLAKAGGLGSGAADAQDDAFDDIADNSKAEIEALFREAISRPWLEAKYPGQGILAEWRLGREKKKDLVALSTIVRNLTAAGYRPTRSWIVQEFGIDVEDRNPGAEAAAAAAAASAAAAAAARKEPDGNAPATVQNASRTTAAGAAPDTLAEGLAELLPALQDSFQPLAEMLGRLIEALEGAEEITPEIRSQLTEAMDWIDAAATNGAPPELADIMERITATAIFNGWAGLTDPEEDETE